MSLKTLRLVLWTLVVVVLAAMGGWYVQHQFREKPAASAAPTPITGIGGPFSLVDQTGRAFTEKDLLGRPTAIFFGYTYCPDVCPTTLLEASGWMKDLGARAEHLRVVFVTVDPERDTPQKLAQYLGSFDPRFIGLSGSREETDRIIKAYRVFARKVEGKGGDYTMDHTAAVYLLDSAARFVGIINFQEPTAQAETKLKRLLGDG